jgi:chromosomal replication initiation ATPase DnaA
MDSYREARVILEKCSISTGVPLKELTGKSRMRNIMDAKFQAREQLRKETDLSLGEISVLTGGSSKNSRIMRTNKAKKR